MGFVEIIFKMRGSKEREREGQSTKWNIHTALPSPQSGAMSALVGIIHHCMVKARTIDNLCLWCSLSKQKCCQQHLLCPLNIKRILSLHVTPSDWSIWGISLVVVEVLPLIECGPMAMEPWVRRAMQSRCINDEKLLQGMCWSNIFEIVHELQCNRSATY